MTFSLCPSGWAAAAGCEGEESSARQMTPEQIGSPLSVGAFPQEWDELGERWLGW